MPLRSYANEFLSVDEGSEEGGRANGLQKRIFHRVAMQIKAVSNNEHRTVHIPTVDHTKGFEEYMT
jgi:hypothetical protein